MAEWNNLRARGRDTAEGATALCTRENLEDSLEMLSEELEALGIEPVLATENQLRSVETLSDLSAKLIDASWQLVQKYRSLARTHEQLGDVHSKISNDNVNLKRRTERLKEDLEKKEGALCRGLERERRLKAQCDGLSRDLKHEKEETLKLRKQAKSRDNQHEHELRRIAQTGYRLREQLQKTIGSRLPREETPEHARSDRENTSHVYKRGSLRRLEEDNRLMLRGISDLKEALSLCSSGIDGRVRASEMQTNARE